jgi:hypothetical protein
MDAFLNSDVGGGASKPAVDFPPLQQSSASDQPQRNPKLNGHGSPLVDETDPFRHSKKMFGEELLSSFTVFEPGANAQGYWTGSDVVDREHEVVEIFEELHPGKVGVFEFDNSTNHSVLPLGALHVGAGVNKTQSGKHAPRNVAGDNPTSMRDGWFKD